MTPLLWRTHRTALRSRPRSSRAMASPPTDAALTVPASPDWRAATVDAHRRASLPPFAPCYSIDFDRRPLTIPIATACGAVESNQVYPPNDTDTARSPHASPSADKRYSFGAPSRPER